MKHEGFFTDENEVKSAIRIGLKGLVVGLVSGYFIRKGVGLYFQENGLNDSFYTSFLPWFSYASNVLMCSAAGIDLGRYRAREDKRRMEEKTMQSERIIRSALLNRSALEKGSLDKEHQEEQRLKHDVNRSRLLR